MPTDTTITRYNLHIEDDDAWLVTHDTGEWVRYEDHQRALTAAHAALAECYRLTGADPDGDEDWRLAPRAVAEVKRLREESDAAHAARDAAERKLAELTAEPICLLRDYQEMRDDLRSLLTTALRERDEARAFIGKLLEHGSWYISAIELDTRHVDGELLKDEAERITSTR